MEENLDLSKNSEINQALKEFDIKSSVEQTQQSASVFISNSSETPKIVDWTMKVFGLREERKAEYILLGLILTIIFVSLFLLFKGNSVGNPSDIKILPA